MKTVVIATIAGGLAGALAYLFVEARAPAHPATIPAAASSPAPVAVDRTATFRANLARAEINTVRGELEAVDGRLQNLERDQEGEPQPASEKLKPSVELGDRELAEWMDGVLGGDEWSRERTHEVEEALEQSVAQNLEGTELMSTECGARFCRAVFSRRDGARPELIDLMGSPPLESSGFTLDREDGTVAVYFTSREGPSLQQIRKQVMAARSSASD